MKLLVYADVQTTDGDELCYTQPNTTLQHFRVARFYSDLLEIYKKFGCEGVVDLGDTTDDRSSIPLPTLKVLSDCTNLLPDGENYKLTGNHEQFLRDTTINNACLFEHKFTVVENRIVWDMDGWYGFFASYPADHKDLAHWLMKESGRVKGKKILFGHFQVVGATLGSATALSGVPVEALAAFDMVLLGHVHQPQSLNERVHYVGSPFQQNWGETGQQKRVAILDTEKKGALSMLTWIRLTNYPEYRRVTLAEFKKIAKEPDEHRYRVALKSHEETEEFFKHPAFNRAVAEYDYEVTPPAEGVDPEKAKDWSFDGICRRYLELVPPSKVGVDLPLDDMLDIGRSLGRQV